MILEYLGLPVVKAKEEADPLCAHILKNNLHISGIISDDSDMLIFGSPVLMRKCMNQQFTIIELTKLINKIKLLLEKIFDKYIDFTMDNLIDFAILLGTDYGTFKLNDNLLTDSLEILKYYILNGMDVKKIISEEQIEHFLIIKKYYSEFNLEENLKYLLDKPFWNKPKLLELKLKLLEFDVDEDYIDKNNQIIDKYYNKFTKINKYKNKYNNTKFYYKKYSLNNE
jgi:5'-3' exonuclease